MIRANNLVQGFGVRLKNWIDLVKDHQEFQRQILIRNFKEYETLLHRPILERKLQSIENFKQLGYDPIMALDQNEETFNRMKAKY